MFREAQQAVAPRVGTETQAQTPIAIQQRILRAIQSEIPPVPPGVVLDPLKYPITTGQDAKNWKYDINKLLTGNPSQSPTARQWQDFKNTVIQKVRQSR